ncbi:interferon-induced protein 44-like [Ostrea edulis]|uniref:interferon-induced protein 44-like n=1 Tax=Ostrea edulis TaxID=37623 RepID=UPI0024AF5D8F|nr:interferon-induced protein 44-like [Ostrea edulis]
MEKNFPWKREFEDELLSEINKITPVGGINYFNILLLGPAAAGKSSFFNTCSTALMDENRLMGNNQVYQGASKTVSTSVEAIPMRTKDGQVLPVRLFDCRGLNMVHGVPTEDIRMIIQGHVKSGYNLTDEETERQLKHVRETLAIQHLPQLVLFTNIDKIRISNTNKLRDIFRSQGVKDTCNKAAEYMQIPLMNVLPMSNYHEENLPTLEKDILALFYLLTMMQRVRDYIKRITQDDVPDDFYD